MPFGNISFRGITKGTNTIVLFGAVVFVSGLLAGHAGLSIGGFIVLLVGAVLTYKYLSR